MPFTDFSGALLVADNGSSLLGRKRISWAVSGGDPAGGFELAIQKDGVNLVGYVYSLAGSDRFKDIIGLPDYSYNAVISARNAAGLVVASRAQAFSVVHANAGDFALAGVCAPATGDVTVTFTPIPGFAGPYKVTLGSRVQEVAASPVTFGFSGEDLAGVALKLRTTVDGVQLGDFIASPVIIDRYVVIQSVDVAQNSLQAKQGKATVTYSTLFSASSTVYDLHRKLESGSSYVLDTSGILSGAVINTPLGVSSASYNFKIVARNANSEHIDHDKVGLMSNAVILRKTLLIPASVSASPSGRVTVSATDISGTSNEYTFDVSGGSQNQSMNGANPHLGYINLANGTHQIRVKVTNNGEEARSIWMPILVTRLSTISSPSINKRMYAGLGQVELNWTHASRDSACAYVARLRKASDGSQVGSDVSMNLLADAASGPKTLLLPVAVAGLYVARLEVTVNGSLFSDEVIVNLENIPFNMALAVAAVNRTANAGLTNPYDLSFSRAASPAGLAGSLFAYSWSLSAPSLPSVLGDVAPSDSLSFALPRTASLVSGKTYTFTVTSSLYGAPQSKSISFLVGTVAHKAVVVDLGVALDASANAAVLDAATPQVLGNIVNCKLALPASALYGDPSDGLIEFKEPSNGIGTISANFTVNASGAAAPIAYDGLNYAKKLVMGMHSCLTGPLDCSAAAPFAVLANRAYDQYASVGDMTLGYIAEKLFGHPAATAAITNDAHIKETMNKGPSDEAAALAALGSAVAAPSINSASDAGDQKLALRLVQTMLFANGVAGDASPAARATRIANSVIGQDADRARGADNNQLAPDQGAALPFYAGDVLFFKLTLKSLDVFQRPLNDTPLYNALKARLADQEFTFKITLA